VIVEGVANPDQARLVEGMDVKYLQGYHFAEPMSAASLGELILAGARLPVR
jgi:EAL domain-containing protein (putative c-di-GMP-specific phosphodiesterase class I)